MQAPTCPVHKDDKSGPLYKDDKSGPLYYLILNLFAKYGNVHHTSAELFHFPRIAWQLQKVVGASESNL